jgi:predicted pyridoxine 5'-phosphate oxidase superfamily flavin-nucleotide-binding protein
MAKMNEKVRSLFENQSLVAMATASSDGYPNVVPIGAKKVLDDETILISDQYFNKTLVNLKENPQVALTVWDTQTFESYQIKGTITIETSGETFDKTSAWIDEMARTRNIPLKSKGAVVVKITDIFTNAPGPDAGSKIG